MCMVVVLFLGDERSLNGASGALPNLSLIFPMLMEIYSSNPIKLIGGVSSSFFLVFSAVNCIMAINTKVIFSKEQA